MEFGQHVDNPVYNLDLIREYNHAGLNILPTGRRKLPIVEWTTYITEQAPLSVFDTNYHGLCVVCGKISGNLEIIDIDNKFRDAKIFINKIREHMGEDFKLFTVNKTRSGGYHLLYRCSFIERNQKLCMRKNTLDYNVKRKDYNVEAILETRGERGIAVIPPTSGYITIRGSMLDIKTIPVAVRMKLIDYCKSLTEIEEIPVVFHKRDTHDGVAVSDRIGDRFNAWIGIGEYIRALLISHGWTFISAERLVRPGKDKGAGHSATLGVCGDNILYVWSPNAYPFEAGKSYTPFAVLAILECSGDFKRAVSIAKDLIS